MRIRRRTRRTISTVSAVQVFQLPASGLLASKHFMGNDCADDDDFGLPKPDPIRDETVSATMDSGLPWQG